MRGKPTVMIVTYNRLELTKQTFETSLKNAGLDFNLVIVDNGSTDGTKDWLCDNVGSFSDSYQVCFLKKNMGVGYGRNMCLKLTKDKFRSSNMLCTLDNDVINPDNWLKDCCDVIENNEATSCGVNFEGVNYRKVIVKLNGEQRVIRIKDVGNLGTACAVFGKNVFDKIGYFHTGFGLYAHEDALYYVKMRKFVGGKIAYLDKPGKHLGVGENDVGEYREMKDKYWNENMSKFNIATNMYNRNMIGVFEDFTNHDESLVDFCFGGNG